MRFSRLREASPLLVVLFQLVAIATATSISRQHVTFTVVMRMKQGRGYDRILSNAVSGALRDFRGVYPTFIPSGKLVLLPEDNPAAILNATCKEILLSRTTTVLHIDNPYFLMRKEEAATSYFAELIEYVGMPTIAWNPGLLESSTAHATRLLQISPTLRHQARAMLSLLQTYNWSDFSLLTTQEPGHDDFLAAIKSIAREPTSTLKFKFLSETIIKNATKGRQLENDLLKLKKTDTRVILLYSSTTEMLDIVETATTLNLTGMEYVWILAMESLTKTERMTAPSSLPAGLLGVWYDSRDEAMKSTIEMGARIWVAALRSLATHLSATGQAFQLPDMDCSANSSMGWPDGATFFSHLQRVQLEEPIPVQFNAEGQLQHTDLKIINLQQRKDAEGKIWVQVGQWSKAGLHMRKITWPGDSPIPPRGKPARRFLRVVTRKEEPYVMYRPMKDLKCDNYAVPCQVNVRDNVTDEMIGNATETLCCTGLSIELLMKLSQALEFDFHLFEVPDGSWGYLKNGEYDGIMGSLTKGEADMAISSLIITKERSQIVDFSVPFLETGITIIVSIREGAVSPTAFLEPYDYPSWCFILVFSVHTTGASIFIFEWLSPYGLDKGHTPLREHKFSLFRSLWLIWAMLFSAAVSTDTPRGMSSRFLANIWALFALVFLASYTANLAAFMITKEEYYDLSGLQDWRLQNPQAMKPPFKFGTVPKGTTESNIKANNQAMYNYMRRYNQSNVREGIEAVKRNKIQAFIYDATVLEYEAGRDKECKLITVGKWYADTGYGVAFPRDSPWVKKVDEVILELQDRGEMHRLQKFWLSGACHHTKKKESSGRSGIGKGVSSTMLGILNFTSAFILLAGGIGLGAILLVFEHLYFRFGRKRLRKLDKYGCCSLVSLSMGLSLSFEQSVKEAVDLHKRHRCRDTICQNQLWRARHDLDLALFRIDKLQEQNADLVLKVERLEAEARWREVQYKPPNGCPPTTVPGVDVTATPSPHVTPNVTANVTTNVTACNVASAVGRSEDVESDYSMTLSGTYTPSRTPSLDLSRASTPRLLSSPRPPAWEGEEGGGPDWTENRTSPHERARDVTAPGVLDALDVTPVGEVGPVTTLHAASEDRSDARHAATFDATGRLFPHATNDAMSGSYIDTGGDATGDVAGDEMGDTFCSDGAYSSVMMDPYGGVNNDAMSDVSEADECTPLTSSLDKMVPDDDDDDEEDDENPERLRRKLFQALAAAGYEKESVI